MNTDTPKYNPPTTTCDSSCLDQGVYVCEHSSSASVADHTPEPRNETRDTLSATNLHGDKWTGETQDGFYVYMDQQGNLYESKERPAYRIVMNNAQFTIEGIAPLHI